MALLDRPVHGELTAALAHVAAHRPDASRVRVGVALAFVTKDP